MSTEAATQLQSNPTNPNPNPKHCNPFPNALPQPNPYFQTWRKHISAGLHEKLHPYIPLHMHKVVQGTDPLVRQGRCNMITVTASPPRRIVHWALPSNGGFAQLALTAAATFTAHGCHSSKVRDVTGAELNERASSFISDTHCGPSICLGCTTANGHSVRFCPCRSKLGCVRQGHSWTGLQLAYITDQKNVVYNV